MSDLLFFMKYLHSRIGWRILVWLSMIVAAAFLDALTVGLFFPIIEDADSNSQFSRAITTIFEFFGLDYSLSIVLLIMAVFFVVRTVFLIFQDIYVSRIITRLLINLKQEVVDKLFRADYRYFISKEIGYFTNAVTIEYGSVANAFEKLMKLIVAAGFAVVYFALPLAINPGVTTVVVLLAVPGYFVLRKVNAITRVYSMRATTNHARLQSYLIQAFQNFKYLTATHSQKGIQERVNDAAEEQGEIVYRQSILNAFMSKSIESVSFILIIALMFYYVQVVGIAVIEILFLLFILRRGIGYALTMQQEYRKFIGSSGSIKVFQTLEEELRDNADNLGEGGIIPDFDQPITLKDVSFDYGNGNMVLDNVNLVIPAKSTVAIVGESGAGKSTLASLLTSLLKPVEGQLLLGDSSYESLDRRLLRAGIGYVTQETVIFNDTVRNNITLWSKNDSDEKVKEAARNSNLTAFIKNLPKDYETQLGDSGVNISGGQRQRISIARELFKDIKLLIFDEATSSLDSHTEQEIQRNIDRFRGEKTVVIIAHRLSTVINSDLIIVLKDGRVVEQGSYKNLYAQGGEFKAMVDLQPSHSAIEQRIATGSGDSREH